LHVRVFVVAATAALGRVPILPDVHLPDSRGAADALERLHDPVFGVAAGTIGWLALVSLISWFREWLEED
jgi:hypothetical protein